MVKCELLENHCMHLFLVGIWSFFSRWLQELSPQAPARAQAEIKIGLLKVLNLDFAYSFFNFIFKYLSPYRPFVFFFFVGGGSFRRFFLTSRQWTADTLRPSKEASKWEPGDFQL